MLLMNNLHKESINADRLIRTAARLQAKIEKFELLERLKDCYVIGRSESSANLSIARMNLRKGAKHKHNGEARSGTLHAKAAMLPRTDIL